MRKVVIGGVLLMVLAGARPVAADVITMKSGGTIKGTIIEKTAESVKMDVGGAALTYYWDDIERIESADGIWTSDSGQSFQASDLSTVPEVSMNKRQLIVQFVELYGLKKALQDNFDYMLGQMNPQEAQKVKKVVSVDEALERLIPVYERHFTEPELKAYVDFYSTSPGQKLIQTMPVIMQESVAAATAYFEEKFAPVIQNP